MSLILIQINAVIKRNAKAIGSWKIDALAVSINIGEASQIAIAPNHRDAFSRALLRI